MKNKGLKYYVVWEGRIPGIYGTWDECFRQIHGFPGAKYKSFGDRGQALEAFKQSYKDFTGKDSRRLRMMEDDDTKEKIEWDSISVDAACSGNPGTLEYRGVYTKNAREIFRAGPYKSGTVNIGEFLAIVHGLAFLKKKKLHIPVYSDSKTAIKWVTQMQVKTKLERSRENVFLFELIDRAMIWLNENQYPNRILKWDTSLWGEIPADFGRK